MPMFNSPNIALGRTKFFRLRKVEGVQNVLNQFSDGIDSVLDVAENAKDTVNLVSSNASSANQTVVGIETRLNDTSNMLVLLNAESENVKNKVIQAGVGADSVNMALADAKTNIDHASTKLLSLNKKVGNLADNVNGLTETVTLLLEKARQISSFPKTLSDDQIQQLWVCERTLHRVEQLVTDKDPDKPSSNNDTLERILKDKLTGESLSILVNDEALRKGIEDIHRPFGNGGVQERYERYVEIQTLRRDIVFFLATPPQGQVR